MKKTLREYLHDRRHALGLTQVELAARSGLSQGRISQIETGDRSIESLSVGSLMKLLRALDVKRLELPEV